MNRTPAVGVSGVVIDCSGLHALTTAAAKQNVVSWKIRRI